MTLTTVTAGSPAKRQDPDSISPNYQLVEYDHADGCTTACASGGVVLGRIDQRR